MRFRFAPPDGTRYICISRRSRTSIGVRDIAEVKEETLIRRTEFGYQIIVRPISFSAMRNDEPLEDAVQEILSTMMVALDVDQSGRLVDITGPDVTDKLIQLFPVVIRPRITELFSKEALFARNKAEWDGRYADLVGRDLDWGDSFDWTGEFVLPTGLKAKFLGTTALIDELRLRQ
jgi:hypothetical protein